MKKNGVKGNGKVSVETIQVSKDMGRSFHCFQEQLEAGMGWGAVCSGDVI